MEVSLQGSLSSTSPGVSQGPGQAASLTEHSKAFVEFGLRPQPAPKKPGYRWETWKWL